MLPHALKSNDGASTQQSGSRKIMVGASIKPPTSQAVATGPSGSSGSSQLQQSAGTAPTVPQGNGASGGTGGGAMGALVDGILTEEGADVEDDDDNDLDEDVLVYEDHGDYPGYDDDDDEYY